MKKLLKKLLVLTMAVSMLVAVNPAQAEAAGYKCNHASLVKVASIKATCVRNGYELYKCKNIFCSYTKKVVTNATGEHAYADLIALNKKYPYAMNKNHTCITCGKVEPHHYEQHVVQNATCTQPELSVSECVCGVTVSGVYESAPATEHNMVVNDEMSAPTLGQYVLECTSCGLQQTELVEVEQPEVTPEVTPEVHEHTYGEVQNAGTYYYQTCTVCGVEQKIGSTFEDTKDEPTDAEPEVHNHNFSVKVDTKSYEATCMKDGQLVMKCESCGEEETTVLPATKAEHKVVIDPAEEACVDHTGKTEGSHCEVCGIVLVAQEEVTEVKHIYGPYANEGTEMVEYCRVCNCRHVMGPAVY